MVGERLEPETLDARVDALDVVEVPRHEASVFVTHELRPEALRPAVGHAEPVFEVRLVHRIGVAARDRDLEQFEAPALQADVVDLLLRDQPRGVLAVGADEPPTGPTLVVVEDVPEPLRAQRARGVVDQLEQLGAERLVLGHRVTLRPRRSR